MAVHYDALISDRLYRAGLPRETVIGFIKEDSGTKFDPKVVDAFLEMMAQEDRGGIQLAGEENNIFRAGKFPSVPAVGQQGIFSLGWHCFFWGCILARPIHAIGRRE